MVGFVLAQLRGRLRRSVALLIAVVAATSGFVVLSGATETSQLRTTGTVNANFRGAYDILVRPKESRTALENERNLLRPNYLSGVFGGITLAQLAQVRALPNVDVAAPMAMIGSSYATITQNVDLTDQVDLTAEHQVLRLTPSWIADRGLTVIDDAPQYVYLSRNALYAQRSIVGLQPPGPVFPDGTALPDDPFFFCNFTVLEKSATGRKSYLCSSRISEDADGTTAAERTLLRVWQRSPGGYSDVLGYPRKVTKRLVVAVTWKVMLTSAAIDPVAEARLIGLDRTMVSGHYLSARDRPAQRTTSPIDGYTYKYLVAPVMLADRSYLDEQLQVNVQQLPPGTAKLFPGREYFDLLPVLAKTPGTPVGTPDRLGSEPQVRTSEVELGLIYYPGSASYRPGADGRLEPELVPPQPDRWMIRGRDSIDYDQPPVYAFDNGFRPLGPPSHGSGADVAAPVGVFDASKLAGFSPLAEVPLGSYQSPAVDGADARSRQFLGDRPLLPNSNAAGYLSAPPVMLANLADLEQLPVRNRDQPLSAIRVRVGGVTGLDPVSQERVRAVAAGIAERTGLDVDIMIGSSPSPQQVTLPAGKYGRPELALLEKWSRKGVAVTILAAADRKSLVLSALILAECAVFLGNAVAASVRSRRRELAVLACLGWPPGRLATGLLGEVALIGLAGGLLAAAISTPLARLAGLAVPWERAASAIPIGLGLAVLAATVPTLSAIRATPAEAVVPAVRPVKRSRHRRTVFGTALSNLARVPGRTALAVLALTVGVVAVTLLTAVLVVYRNQVVGSLLGAAVTVQVRPVDIAATAATIALGIVAVADVLYLNVRERAGEIAALWAAGWTDNALIRLVVYEGLGIGLAGAVTGTALGLLGISLLVGEVTTELIVVCALTAIAATVLAGLCSVVPALMLRRLPLAALLAEE